MWAGLAEVPNGVRDPLTWTLAKKFSILDALRDIEEGAGGQLSYTSGFRGRQRIVPVLGLMELEQLGDGVDEARVDATSQELGVRQHIQQEGNVVLHSSNPELIQRALQLL
jgi:hypothetical protein